MFAFINKNRLNSTKAVDEIEKTVYEYLKPFGFQKHGRTLHRFVDGDISQIVHFQNGSASKKNYDVLWVNLGIRVPESAEHKFLISSPQKKYYREYECNIRNRLGVLVNGRDTVYHLKKDPHKIGKDIVKKLSQYVIPVFETLNSRDAILNHRQEYVHFDEMHNDLILLDDAMIYGRKGNIKQAEKLFNLYYQKERKRYKYDYEHGSKMYLRKGERVTYHNVRTNQSETIVAKKSGFVVLYDAQRKHLEYLEQLAKELNIKISEKYEHETS